MGGPASQQKNREPTLGVKLGSSSHGHDAPVGWFYLLALGGDASVQICVQVFGWPCAFISVVLFIFPRYGGVESLDYRVVLCLPFGVTATIFPAAAPSCIPTTNVQGLQFLHILTSTGYFPFCFI